VDRAQPETGEGGACRAPELASAAPSSGAARRLLPEGEKKPLTRPSGTLSRKGEGQGAERPCRN